MLFMENFKLKIIDFVGTIAMWFMVYLDDIIETIISVLTTAVICYVITNFFFMPVVVSGNSMYPNLKDKQFGFSNIIDIKINGINRFDVVVIKKTDENEKLVKRVIGLPGEIVTCTNGNIFINGKRIDEYYLDEDYIQQELNEHDLEYFTTDFTYVLENDEYFCLGDNRYHSTDSRFYGPFKKEQIVSKGVLVLFPFNQIGVH